MLRGFWGGLGGEETPPGLAVGQEGSGGAGEGVRGAVRDPSHRGVGGGRSRECPDRAIPRLLFSLLKAFS